MGDDNGLGLLPMAVCFDFHSTNVVQLSNQNPYFYRFQCHHPIITQFMQEIESYNPPNSNLGRENDFLLLSYRLHRKLDHVFLWILSNNTGL